MAVWRQVGLGLDRWPADDEDEDEPADECEQDAPDLDPARYITRVLPVTRGPRATRQRRAVAHEALAELDRAFEAIRRQFGVRVTLADDRELLAHAGLLAPVPSLAPAPKTDTAVVTSLREVRASRSPLLIVGCTAPIPGRTLAHLRVSRSAVARVATAPTLATPLIAGLGAVAARLAVTPEGTPARFLLRGSHTHASLRLPERVPGARPCAACHESLPALLDLWDWAGRYAETTRAALASGAAGRLYLRLTGQHASAS